MKITLQHAKLAKALSYTSKAVATKPNIPILSNVYLEVDKDSLKLAATNLEMGLQMWIPGQAETEGQTTANAKFIADFVSATTTDHVDVQLNDTMLHVETTQSKANFTTIPSEEFPVLPELAAEPIFKIDAEAFKNAMQKVLFAASTDLSAGKIQQSGVFFDIIDGSDEIDFVGLDGFRLSKKTVQISEKSSNIVKEEIIVPARYLNEVVKILGDYPEVETIDVFLSQNNSQIVFKFEEIEFSIRLLDGPYPDYKKILPDEHSYTFEVDKKIFEDSLKIANTFARGNLGNKVLFDFDIETSRVILESTVSEVGDGRTEVEVTNVDGESDLNTAYTLRYLQDFVNHIDGDSIIYETKGPLAASVLRDKEDPDYLHLIMPMRREA